MPKLGRYAPILDSVLFLYENRADALAGSKIGGTGFFVGLKSKRYPDHVAFIHAVTNWHVAVHGRPSCPVIRINKRDGGTEVVDLDPSEWFFIPGGPDIAVSPAIAVNFSLNKIVPLDVESMFLTSAQEHEHEVGPGEDAFMVGKFVDFDGGETNVPAVRFGHISIMDAKIPQSSGYKGRSIVVDMHSRTGFSGSPVFCYRTLGSHFLDQGKPGEFLTGGGHYLRLLGIHWGQFPEEWEIKKGAAESVVKNASLIRDSDTIQGLSGMTCVAPASDINRVLNLPELEAMRRKWEDDNIRAIKSHLRTAPKIEGASKTSAETEDNPNHLEDFTRLVDVAARKRPQGGRT